MDRDAPAPSRRRDRGFTDEEIFEILRAGEAEGASAAELCAIHDVAFPAYCLWKSRYRHLSLPELIALRRSERRKTLLLRGTLVTALALGSAGVGLFVLSGAAPTPASADTGPGARPVVPKPAVPAAKDEGVPAAVPPPAPAVPAAAAAAEKLPSPPAAPGFAVQVAAEPDARGAGTIVEQLAAAGYSAYVLPATFGELELYRVRLGPFGTRREAQEVVRRLEEEGYDGPWITNP